MFLIQDSLCVIQPSCKNKMLESYVFLLTTDTLPLCISYISSQQITFQHFFTYCLDTGLDFVGGCDSYIRWLLSKRPLRDICIA